MTRRARDSGVTLIELLIAVTLVSLISAGLLTAMRVGLSAMNKVNSHLLANRKAIGAERILEQQIAGFMPVMATCMAMQNRTAGDIKFFQGEPQSMRFVSTYSIQEASRGGPQILEFQVIPGENGVGVRLVVNEFPYTGPLAAGFTCLGVMPDPAVNMNVPRFRPIAIGPSSFVLADKLAACQFLYRQKPDPPRPERWLPRWLIQSEWPSAIRVEMLPLNPDPSHLQLLPVTVPVRATKDPLYAYTEF